MSFSKYAGQSNRTSWTDTRSAIEVSVEIEASRDVADVSENLADQFADRIAKLVVKLDIDPK